MKLVLALIVFLARCCVEVHSQARIVGGSAVAAGKYPFFAFVLVDVSNGSIPCGASLVHSDILLTSASCVASESGGVNNDIIEVALNFTNFDDSEGSVTRKVSSMMVHPEFNSDTLSNDIAMLLLENTITNVTTAAYNTNASIPFEDSSVTVIGFGSLSAEEFEPSRTLQEVTLQVVDFRSCDDVYGGILNEDTQICGAVPGGGMDSCIGDAGGPLLNEDDLIVGIVSGGNGCGQAGIPGFNTRVSGYVDFISQGICDMSSEKPTSCTTGPVVVPTLPPITSAPVVAMPVLDPTNPQGSESPVSAPSIASQPVVATITIPPASYSPIVNPQPVSLPTTITTTMQPIATITIPPESYSPITTLEPEPVAIPPSTSPVVVVATETAAPITMIDPVASPTTSPVVIVATETAAPIAMIEPVTSPTTSPVVVVATETAAPIAMIEPVTSPTTSPVVVVATETAAPIAMIEPVTSPTTSPVVVVTTETAAPIAMIEPVTSPTTSPVVVVTTETAAPIAMIEPVAAPSTSPVVVVATETAAPIARPTITIEEQQPVMMTLEPSEGKKGRESDSTDQRTGEKTKSSKKSTRGKGSASSSSISGDDDDDDYEGKKAGSLRLGETGEYRRKVRGL